MATKHTRRRIYSSYDARFIQLGHVDSTIMPLRPGLVVLNAERVDEDKVPMRYSKHGIRYGTQKKCVLDSPSLEDYVPASSWIGMNVLSIDPQHVLVPSEEIPPNEGYGTA